MKFLKSILLIAVGIMLIVNLVSCANNGKADRYEINTIPYQAKDGTIDDTISAKPEDVIEIGGKPAFTFSGGVKYVDDNGEIIVSEDGVDANVVIDKRSGK